MEEVKFKEGSSFKEKIRKKERLSFFLTASFSDLKILFALLTYMGLLFCFFKYSSLIGKFFQIPSLTLHQGFFMLKNNKASSGGLEDVNGEKRGHYELFSTIKIFFKQ